MHRLLAALYRRFGLRWRRAPMAFRKRQPYGPHAPFRITRDDDGLPYVTPRAAS